MGLVSVREKWEIWKISEGWRGSGGMALYCGA